MTAFRFALLNLCKQSLHRNSHFIDSSNCKKNMLWPGLNAPVIQGREVLRQIELPPDEERQKRILELRDKSIARRSFKLHPLEKGWTGNKLPGRSLGPPDPVGEGFALSTSVNGGTAAKAKSPEQLANEKGLHVVEMRKNRDYYPVVVASPERCRTEEEIGPTELLDFNVHLFNGKVEAPREKYKPFYVNFPSYIKEMKDRESLRNQKAVRIHLLSKYGALKSFINVREEEKAKKELKETVEE
ncbi:putative 28S ribosomal protein S5 like protein [Argiope bruennichi]|uniref:Putative 28S ribosomal protein S5 like protein n=1 Tax=Argiope bruennichi TaxID=94029 RepID=A0A8T0DZT8_ARGBR|nr:putative 28S ribosomal protein S5 like protein [Argiope bruennichi]